MDERKRQIEEEGKFARLLGRGFSAKRARARTRIKVLVALSWRRV